MKKVIVIISLFCLIGCGTLNTTNEDTNRANTIRTAYSMGWIDGANAVLELVRRGENIAINEVVMMKQIDSIRYENMMVFIKE